MVEGASAFERGTLDVAVPAHPQQQGDVGEPVDEHAHGAAEHRVETLGRGSDGRARLVEHALQPAQRLVEGEREQLLLRIEVVVQRRLGQAEARREIGDRGGVVALFVEEGDSDRQHLRPVIPGRPRRGAAL
nr:hypothetical protein GCM10025699_01300 [Microbacterium flavescens]